eukprot:Gb_29900 [translate_table: standard]
MKTTMRILIVTTMKIATKKKIVYQKNNLIKDMSMTKTLMKIRMKNTTLNVKITTMTKMSKRIVKIRIMEVFPKLESPPTSDNKDKIDEMLEDNIVKLKGKEDESNIPTFNQPKNPEEHEDGGRDHIIQDDNEDVCDPFPIVPQTKYSGYDDLTREDVDKNDDHNEDYEGSDKNPNKEEDHKNKIFGEEYYSDKKSR